ncbi:hypothetical protein [Nocardia sp. NPDC046763]|uniref:hypothetical protein n=1 Tax=Nocardia sp. NPDC046763 TaxID=3155256 RepID=UPI003406A779
MPRVTPLAMADYAVIGALNVAGGALTVDGVAAAVSLPSSGPGMSLSHDSVRRIVTRLEARGLAENGSGGWQLTRRGRVLWDTKGKRFIL